VVGIYVRRFDTTLSFEDSELDICEAYDQALIGKYHPEWNNYMGPKGKLEKELK
jgi:hypothetical protein